MARGYDNAARTEAAAETRARILVAARDLILEKGYAKASIAAIADAAGVSPQTIYNAVGNKAAVLKACYDVTLAGDDEPIPMSARAEFTALGAAATASEWTRAYARWSKVIAERVGALLEAVIAPGTATDAGVADFVATIERERRIGSAHAVAAFAGRFGLPDGLAQEHAVDIVWTLNSPEVHGRLVHRCGWTPDAYEAWLAGQLAASLT